jgi:hypothetical protein
VRGAPKSRKRSTNIIEVIDDPNLEYAGCPCPRPQG